MSKSAIYGALANFTNFIPDSSDMKTLFAHFPALRENRIRFIVPVQQTCD